MLAVLLSSLLIAPTNTTFKVDGVLRTAIVVAPEKAPKAVIIAFHGHGGNGRYMMRKNHFETLWPEALVIYPDGLTGVKGRTDPQGKKPGWQKSSGELGDRDLKFADEMRSWAIKTYKANPKSFVVMGHSNGGAFVNLLYQARHNDYAAYANCAGGGGGPKMLDVSPKPLFMTIGKNDPLVSSTLMMSNAERIQTHFGAKPVEKQAYEGIQVLKGKAPLWFWWHDGDHEPPAKYEERVVDFFRAAIL